MEKKSFVLGAFVSFLAFAVSSSFAQTTNTAPFSADCRSFKVNTISYVNEFQNTVNDYFTTYDGTNDFPANIDYTTNGAAITSGEFAYITNSPRQFRTSYINTTTTGLQGYGSYIFTLSTNQPTDTNNNGLLDITELSQSVSNNFTATITPLASGTNIPPIVSGYFLRDSNAFTGSFIFSTSNSIVTSNTLPGTFELQSMAGTISYVRGFSNTLSFSLSNNTTTITGTTTFYVSNFNTVVLPQFQLTGANTNIYLVAAGTTFHRTNGNTYIANAKFLDGYAPTLFHDYTNWVFQFTDPNDTDGNEIPDFSDTYIPPFFNGAAFLGSNIFYLAFTNGTPFGYYNLYNLPYFYHYDLGFEYFFDAQNGINGAYFYDFSSGTFFYTDPTSWPNLYDFTLNSWIYYFPSTTEFGRYSSNPRQFYNYSTGHFITK